MFNYKPLNSYGNFLYLDDGIKIVREGVVPKGNNCDNCMYQEKVDICNDKVDTKCSFFDTFLLKTHNETACGQSYETNEKCLTCLLQSMGCTTEQIKLLSEAVVKNLMKRLEDDK